MEPITSHTGKAIVMLNNNIDTDQIIPKQFLKNILKTGYAPHLFFDWRYDQSGKPKPDFALNKPENQGATILISGENFGCGSSREHAVWSLTDWGFKVVIAGSFSDIFYMNSTKNGLLAISLPAADRKILNTATSTDQITVNLVDQYVEFKGQRFHFDIDPMWKNKFINGLDDIDITMKYEDQIGAYEAAMPTFD